MEVFTKLFDAAVKAGFDGVSAFIIVILLAAIMYLIKNWMPKESAKEVLAAKDENIKMTSDNVKRTEQYIVNHIDSRMNANDKCHEQMADELHDISKTLVSLDAKWK